MVNLRDNTISLRVHSYMHKFKSCPFAASLVSELYVLSLFLVCVCAVGTDLNLNILMIRSLLGKLLQKVVENGKG